VAYNDKKCDNHISTPNQRFVYTLYDNTIEMYVFYMAFKRLTPYSVLKRQLCWIEQRANPKFSEF
jgi:hypothetical protein